MKLLFTGDFVITDEFVGKNLIDPTVVQVFKTADFRIINLEAPITPNISNNKILKTGPNLRTSEKTILPSLKTLQTDMVSIANNHILDFGSTGLMDTLNVLTNHKISYVGAGKDLKEAKKYRTIVKNGLRIAILNFAENEWSTTNNSNPGANPLDIVDNSQQIQIAKKNHDRVICIVHGGHQLYKYPSPRIQKLFRFFVDQGADAVVSHHSHCISGAEEYKGCPIYYGLGNFLFTLPYKYEGFHEGIILELIIQKGQPVIHNPIFVKQDINSHFLELTTSDDLEKIKNRFQILSMEILDKDKLESYWTNFITEKENQYLNMFSLNSLIRNRYLNALLKKLKIRLLHKETSKILLNTLRCEAHNELSIEILRRHLRK